MEAVEPIEQIYEFMEMLIRRYGSMGIAAAMFAESAGLPFASAVVLLTSGTMILRGTVSFWSIFFASTIGITLGSIFSYLVGLAGSYIGKAVWLNRIRNNRPDDQKKSTNPVLRFWKRYGNFSIFMGQFWGVTRTFISFPAGAMHMNFPLFIIYTLAGGALFSLAMIGLSIALTGTMSLTLKALRLLADFSPWLLLIPVILVIVFVYIYRSRGWKVSFPFNNGDNNKKEAGEDNKDGKKEFQA